MSPGTYDIDIYKLYDDVISRDSRGMVPIAYEGNSNIVVESGQTVIGIREYENNGCEQIRGIAISAGYSHNLALIATERYTRGVGIIMVSSGTIRRHIAPQYRYR